MTHEIIERSKEIFPLVREFRRHIHAHPELSFRETATQAYIMEMLAAEGIECRPIAGTGVLARLEGGGDLHRAVVLRADIDALPITEETGLEFSSTAEGVMHACGHDMHAAALFGALVLLHCDLTNVDGTVFGLFQPGEERNPGGASLVLAEDPFADYDVRAFIGEHTEPEMATGMFGFRPGKYMASSDELRITVRGTGGHAAMRDRLKDPVATAAEIITALLAIPADNPDRSVPSVVSIGQVVADGSTNVIPDTAYLEGTIRTFDESWRERIKERIGEICAAAGENHGTTVDVNISKGFPCVVNNVRLTDLAAQVAASLFGQDSVVEVGIRPTAEDFGFYTQRYPSLFYRFGVGNSAVDETCTSARPSGRLHTPTLCPNENALIYAPALMARLATEL